MIRITRMVLVLAACALPALAAAQTIEQRPDERNAERRATIRARQETERLRQQAAQTRRTAERQRQETERARRVRREAELRSWPEIAETFSRTVPLGRNGTLDLQNVAGNIVVTGGGGDQARIEAIKRARHPSEKMARALLAGVQIALTERGGNLDVRTAHPRRTQGVAAVDFTVRVPSGANVALRTVSGDVRVTNVAGELRINASKGNVTTSKVRRVRQITTVTGNVDISDAEADELTTNTVGGHVTVRNLKGRLLELNTVSGNVRLVDVDASRARLQSMAGDLDYSGALARNGKYEFQTHSGTITLTPLRNPGFDVEAVTLRGAVRSEFALKASVASRQTDTRRSLRGTVGDAGAMVTAQSFSGDIVLVRR